MFRYPGVSTAPATPPEPSALATAADQMRGRLMAKSLGRLLDQAPGAREVLPHLAALERGLLSHGSTAVDRVPAHWLGRICSQLSSLPLPEDDPPLHDLLKRLMQRLHAQRNDWEPGDLLPTERTVVVTEVSHSEFAAVQEAQATTVFTPRL